MSFALIQLEPFEVLQRFPGVFPPDPLLWPNGEASHGIYAGFVHGNFAFVEAISSEPPGEFYGLLDVMATFDGTRVTYQRTWEAHDLLQVKATLVQRLNDAAEAQRQAHLTPGHGQSLVYAQKLIEATALANDRAPVSSAYPLLSASVGIEDDTLVGVGEIVRKAASEWSAVAAKIEALRLKGKAAIAAATHVDAAVAAFNAVTWS